MFDTEVACDVHWTNWRISPLGDAVLSPADERRLSGIRRADILTPRRVAAALLRSVVAHAVGAKPDDVIVDRTCPRCGAPHGRPTLPFHDLEVSVTHSGDLVGVAICRGSPLGLDAEQVSRFHRSGPLQHISLTEAAESAAARCRAWVRAEAVVKATGQGIVALEAVRVAPASEPPALLTQDDTSLQVVLVDLEARPGYRASLAVLTEAPVQAIEKVHDGQPA